MLILLIAFAYADFIVTTDSGSVSFYNEYCLPDIGRIPYSEILRGSVRSVESFCEGVNKTMSQKWAVIEESSKCTIMTQVLNAQKSDVRLVIIRKNKLINYNDSIQYEDGNGFKVYIPVVVVGTQITQYMDDFPEFVALFDFKVDITRARSKVYFFGVDIQNRESFRFIRDFKEDYLLFKGFISVNVFYHLESFGSDSDCVSKKYCLPKPDGGSGADVVHEVIRQVCLFEHSEKLWYDYVQYFDENCIHPMEFQKCFAAGNSKTTVEAISECTKNPDILQVSLAENTRAGIAYYPGVSMNRQITFKGIFESKRVVEFICEAFEHESVRPSNCIEYIGVGKSYRTPFIVLMLVIPFLIVLGYLYRRHIKKQMQTEARVQVSNAINDYMMTYVKKSNDLSVYNKM